MNFQLKKIILSSTAHRRGALPSPAFAAATELMMLRRSWCCAQLASLLEVLPRPSSRCCRRWDDHLSANMLYIALNWSSAAPRPTVHIHIYIAIVLYSVNILLLRRSCCCCDGAAQLSVALILRVASLGRDLQNDETGIHFPPWPCWFEFKGSWGPQS